MDLSRVDLFAPHVEIEKLDPRLAKILNLSLSGYRGDAVGFAERTSYWNADSLGLSSVGLFNALDLESRENVLRLHTADLMREAAYIEVAGLSYTARMSLESSKLDQRLFYATMAAEEAKHFSLLRPFVEDDAFAKGPDAFTGLIGQMIVEADREQVIFLIQVLLEGWGLNHFNWMAVNCQNDSLKAIFKIILKDEARHHAAGLALASCKVRLEDLRVVQWLEVILESVRLGPVRLLSALQSSTGALSGCLRQQVLDELDARSTVVENLARLTSLIESHVESSVLRRFEERGLLRPAF